MVDPTHKSGVRLWSLPVSSPAPPRRADAPKEQAIDSASRGNGLARAPLAKTRGAWLSAVRGLRGDRTRHSLDAERARFDLDSARARAGDGVLRLHQLAVEAASDRQRAQLESGDTSWGAFYRLAAKAIFGSSAAEKLRYAEIESRMRALGLDEELDAILAELPRPLLIELRAKGVAPLELFHARGLAICSWTASDMPISIADLRAELALDGRSSELDRLLGSLESSTAARLENGELRAAEVARLLEDRRREEVDVLVIGAGAAGIGAANALIDGGLSVTVLESKSRHGGRAYTEADSLGLPFDHGCAWIHESNDNPFLPMVEALGFRTVPTEKFQKVFAGGDPEQDASLLRERMNEVSRRWQKTAAKRPDAKASLVSAPEHRLDRMAAEVLGPLELALELDQFSVGEFQSIVEEKDDRLVEGGLGNVVRAFAHGLPIELESPVEKIEWSKQGVEVQSNGRTFRAKKIILTVSPSVLAERIAFYPPLPAWKVQAIDGLQMASFEKIALSFAPGALAAVAPFERACGFDEQGRSFELLMKPFGEDIALVMVGADFAKELLQKPEREAVDYALGVIAEHYGAELRSAFVSGARTDWTLDPDVGGTWAVSKLGATNGDRTAYAAPVDDTIFIAGEACGGDWAATVNGAFFNGRDVAAQISAASSTKKASNAPDRSK